LPFFAVCNHRYRSKQAYVIECIERRAEPVTELLTASSESEGEFTLKKKLILSSLGTFVVGVLAGGALLYNDDVYSAVKETITGEDLQNTVAGFTRNGY
jgi:hypothetical protein